MSKLFSNRNVVVGFIALILIIITAFNFTNIKEMILQTGGGVEKPTTHKFIHSADYAVSGNINGLVGLSDFIVIGQYEEFKKEWEMGEKYFGEVYTFKVDEILQGDTKGTIEVAIPHYTEISSMVDGKEYLSNIELQNYSKPDLNSKYVLFLKYYEPADTFTPASVPFQIQLNQDGTTRLISSQDDGFKAQRISENETIEVQFERVDIQSIDVITGTVEKELREDLINAINFKNNNLINN